MLVPRDKKEVYSYTTNNFDDANDEYHKIDPIYYEDEDDNEFNDEQGNFDYLAKAEAEDNSCHY